MEQIQSKEDYNKACARYEKIKDADKGSEEHNEKLLLVDSIIEYEKREWDLPEPNKWQITKYQRHTENGVEDWVKGSLFIKSDQVKDIPHLPNITFEEDNT